MTKCASCQAELPPDGAFCPECGAAVAGAKPIGNAPPAPAASRTFSGLETVAYGKANSTGATQALEAGATFADRYVITSKIGEGGMGVVYAAKDGNTGEEIVLKLIHPGLVAGEEAMKRLVAEGVTARQIRHPNIVAVYDVGQVDGQPYLTMEHVKGGTLRTWMVNAISSGKETGLNTALGIVRSILAGLAEAHRMGFVHRDLKPENILLNGDPAQGDFGLKILDFGIAKAIGSRGATRSGGSSGGVGTPLYMAPEQWTAPDTVGPSADLYSVTAILYELLMEAAPQGRWESPSDHRADAPKALDKLIERGLATRARTRPQSVADYVAALDEATQTNAPPPEQAPIIGKPLGPEPEVVRKPEPQPVEAARKNNRMLIWGSVAAVLLVGGGIGVMLDQPTPPPRTLQPQPPPQPQPIQPQPPQPPQPPPLRPLTPAAINASGTWYDDAGNAFYATQIGANISASGFVQGGPVVIEGTLASDGMKFQVASTATGQLLFRGDGYVLDQGHLSYALYAPNGALVNRGCFHLNHAPRPPCVNGRF